MRILLILISIIVSSTLKAQGDLSLASLEGVQQRAYLNPVFIPQEKFSLGLPILSSVQFSGASSRFPISKFVSPDPNSSALIIDAEAVASRVQTTANLNLGASYDWFSLSKALSEKSFLRFSIRERMEGNASLPSNLFRLMSEGNALGLQDENVSFDGFSMDFNWYREFALAYSRKLNDKLIVGLSAKYLQGIANIGTIENNLQLRTDAPFYDLSLSGGFQYQTANTAMLRRDSSIELFSKTPFWSNNQGFGFDFGLEYSINEKLKLGISLLDIGQINYNNRAYLHTSNFDSLNYSGFDLLELFSNDQNTASPEVSSFLGDSLIALLNFSKESSQYKIILPYSINAFVSYQLNEKSQLNSSIRFVKRPSFWQSAVQLSYMYSINESFRIGANYSAGSNGMLNFGTQAIVLLGPVQVYAAIDNLPGLFVPQDVKYWSSRLGINLVF